MILELSVEVRLEIQSLKLSAYSWHLKQWPGVHDGGHRAGRENRRALGGEGVRGVPALVVRIQQDKLCKRVIGVLQLLLLC